MNKLKILTIFIIIITILVLAMALSLKSKPDISPSETADTSGNETESPAPEIQSPVPDDSMGSFEPCYYYLDDYMFEPNAQAGTVDTYSYSSASGEKRMQIYLPYGYSEERQYNVLVLLHGSEGSENYWFGEYQYYDEKPIELKNLIDNMIYWGTCEPLIVVSPTYYANDEERENGDVPARDFERTASELRNDIIPFLKEHFSVYETREHYAFIGASYGSIILYNSVLPRDFDLFSWWGAISGYDADIYSINESLSRFPEDMGIDFFYTSAGTRDSMKRESLLGYNNMFYMCPKINGTNICYTEIINAAHNGRVWVNGIYNCLLVFFKS